MRRLSGLALSYLVLLGTLAANALAQAPQSPNFNRTKTVRREVTAGPARGGQGAGTVAPTSPARRAAGDPIRPYSTRTPGPAASTNSQSSGAPGPLRSPQPMSVQVRSTPHAFYPGMRPGQGPNQNVAVRARRKTGGTGLSMPGMMVPGGG